MPATPAPSKDLDRLSLFRCDHCGRTVPATPAEVRGCVRAMWPRCCKCDMVLFISAERPEPTAPEVVARRLTLPVPDPAADTASFTPLANSSHRLSKDHR